MASREAEAAGGRCRLRRMLPVQSDASLPRSLEPHRPHRTLDVLQGALAGVLEHERRLAADLSEGIVGEVHAARFALALHPCGDVHAVSEDVAVVRMMSPTLMP